MLRDVTPLSEPLKHSTVRKDRAIGSFLEFVEQKLGRQFLVDTDDLPSENPEVSGIARALRHAGIIGKCTSTGLFFDEPPIAQWRIAYKQGATFQTAGGMSVDNSERAFVPALAEALERHIWGDESDYFITPRTGTAREAEGWGKIVAPERFAGFSDKQRQENPRLTLSSNAEYLWIQGRSLVHEAPVWLPAQVASGFYGSRVNHQKVKEPMILVPITTGLATGETREDALLGGMLEIVERDAFMITWLNQLTPPRLNLSAAAKTRPSLARLLDICARYRLEVDVALLPTDVPTHAVCAVVRDRHGGPEVTVGLNAHFLVGKAAEGAILEALRARQTIRMREKRGNRDAEKEKSSIYHLERAEYWARNGRHTLLQFLFGGAETTPKSPWDSDTVSQHYRRLVAWCREKEYECAAVDLGRSAKNVTPWHIAMVVVPEMQPMHQSERFPYLGGRRLKEVPDQLGYPSRPKPFMEEPHPFA